MIVMIKNDIAVKKKPIIILFMITNPTITNINYNEIYLTPIKKVINFKSNSNWKFLSYKLKIRSFKKKLRLRNTFNKN